MAISEGHAGAGDPTLAGSRKKRKQTEPELEQPAPPGRLAVWKRRLKMLLVTGAVLAAGVWWLLPQIGLFLAVADEPQPAEVLVVLSGDRGERLEHAVRLYEAGLADLFILSGGPLYADLSEADLLRRHALILGVPEGRIIMEPRAANTYQNAVYTRELMEFYGFESALVISSPYHMRRVRMLFEEVYEGSGIELCFVSAAGSWFDPERWWETSGGRWLVLNEYAKLSLSLLPAGWRCRWYGGDLPAAD